MSAFVPVWRKIASIYGFLIVMNVVGWAWAFVAFRAHPVLLGTALLAYTFGLRHAVDADHIAAIDSVTRKLMHDGKRPVSVGLFFSLGHSTIVVLMSAAIALSAGALGGHIPALQSGGGFIGTTISVLFLLAIAVINLNVLIDVLRGNQGPAMPRGLLGRLFAPVLKSIDAAWKMYPVGALFGLGFDTATEIGLLGIAAIEAGKGLPMIDIMIFPFLFTAGMSLLDTTDGILMLGAYGWAFVKPERKRTYNITVTSVSIFAAVFVGGIESLSLLKPYAGIGDHLGAIGFAIVAVFMLAWLAGVILSGVRSAPRRASS